MKVLFVSSGNSGKVGVLVNNQAETLRNIGIEVDHYLIIGKGFFGYLNNIPKLHKYLKSGNYEIVHAHYSLTAFITTMAGAKNLVVSLMGSDAFLTFWMKLAAWFFYSFFWRVTIVKTEEMKKTLMMPKAIILPNGVDLSTFNPINQNEARKILGIEQNIKVILFIADPSRKEKNHQLALDSVKKLDSNNVKLFTVYDKPNELIPTYLSAGDVLLLTSIWEGSVNVVKEALACNLPIVSTDVGDVRKNILGIEGCYICQKDSVDISEKLKMAIAFNNRTKGRQRIIDLKLDSDSVAKELLFYYKQILK